MALLTRVRQKIFGGSGATGEFGKIGSKAAGSPVTTKDLELIQELSQYDSGYFSIVSDQGTSKLPYSEDLNSLFFLMTSQLAYLFQSGVPEWLNDIDQRYYAGVSLVNRNGRIYIAILGDDGANVNAQRDPETEPTWWKQIAGPPKETTISVTGAFTPGSQNERLIIDTTLGSVTVTIADGTFDGQRLNVHCIDAGTANGFYKGTGIYDGASSLGTPLSPGFDIWLEWSETEGRWTYEDVVTADRVISGQIIIQKSSGEMINICTPSGTANITTVDAAGGFRSPISAVNYSLAFSSLKAKKIINVKGAVTAYNDNQTNLLNTDVFLRSITSVSGLSYEVRVESQGAY